MYNKVNRQNTSLDNTCTCYTIIINIHNSEQLGVRVFGDCDLLELQPLNYVNHVLI